MSTTQSHTKMWLQDWGTYKEQTLVCIGGPPKCDIISWLKKRRCNASFIADVESDLDVNTIDTDGYFFKAKGVGSIIWLKEPTASVRAIAILSHEVMHAVYRILMQNRGMVNEIEGVCYQFEFLMKEILGKWK